MASNITKAVSESNNTTDCSDKITDSCDNITSNAPIICIQTFDSISLSLEINLTDDIETTTTKQQTENTEVMTDDDNSVPIY